MGRQALPAAFISGVAIDAVRASRRLKVLLLVSASFFLLWLSIKVFAHGDLWPLLLVPILTGGWFFYEAGALLAAGLAALLLVQTSWEKPGMIMLALTTFAAMGLMLGWGQRRQRQAHRHILRSSLTDPLTGLFNYGYFMDCLEREISRVDRYGGCVTLIMIDIDHFKLFNDRFGHEKGNDALKAVASTLRREKRSSDIIARYGGEEFVLLLPGDEEAGEETANRLRKAVAGLDIPMGGGSSTGVTVSVGVACYPHSAGSKEEILDRVDQLLYTSKRRGRNQVSVAPARQRLAAM
jgi:diguanylate cyclase (GGDEF)-like protein